MLVGAPTMAADLQYCTGFSAPDAMVFLQCGRRRHLVVSSMEYNRARRVVKDIRVWTPADLVPVRVKGPRYSHWILGLLKKLRLRAVTVPSDFPLGLAQFLSRRNIRVRVTEKEIFPQRQIKTTAERAMIRESQRAAVAAMRAAVKTLAGARVNQKGILCEGKTVLTSERLKRVIHRALLDRRCHCPGLIVACGKQAADPHERGYGPLRANQPIVLDIFPQHQEHGYWGDLTRTVVKGRAPEKLRRMMEAARAAQRAALKHIRPGARANAIHEQACAEMRRRGFPTKTVKGVPQGFIHSTGHGVGLEIHEAPALARHPTRLRAGQVVTVEPGLYYVNQGLGVRFEDLVEVTRNGWKAMAFCEPFFEVR